MFASAAFCVHTFIVIAVAIKVIFRRLPVGTSLAWIIIVATFPFIGFGVYMLIGDHRLGRKRLRMGAVVRNHYQNMLAVSEGAVAQHPEVSSQFMKIGDVAAKGTGFHIRSDNYVQVLSKPEEMFDGLLQDISNAKQTCFVEFYIIDPNGRVKDVLEALIAAAERGVDCRLIADHIGSRQFFKSVWIARLKAAGVKLVDSLPTGILKTFFVRSDLRNHRKIVVIDGNIGYTGSFNLADPDFFNCDKDFGPWVDLFIRMEGDAAEALDVVFNTDYVLDTWIYGDLEDILLIDILPPLQDAPNALDDTNKKPLQVIPSGPEMATSVIYETIISSIYTAQKYIAITTPYLIPDEPLLLALTNAARRGVDVSIIVPAKVDSIMVRFASRSYYSELLSAGINIFEFKSGLLHSKTILIDDSVCYVGTVNLDMRSFYLNLEITLALHSLEDCAVLREIIDNYKEKSVRIPAENWLDGTRSKSAMFAENLVRLASPLL